VGQRPASVMYPAEMKRRLTDFSASRIVEAVVKALFSSERSDWMNLIFAAGLRDCREAVMEVAASLLRPMK